ncbi:SHOCT domain-containing protein [Halorussus salilacus]|uniref:SHOCT domain-containing protein n=1 Tax=Halorussus salilacus TaxID=2953750 RepID=UPI00209CD0C1|nr:SHOCT domain-containing protein [Halorussus salilacus]USZ69026.1 SHOCT domain-containing protein [Halorussus salilacus]
MGPLRDRTVTLLLAGFLTSLVVIVGLTAFGLLAVAAALASAASGASPLFVAVEAAAPFVAGLMLVGVLSVALFVATTVAAVRRASMPRSQRLARVARLVERVSEDAREFGLAERFEPTHKERLADLKRAYVEGEMTEWEYERRLETLLVEEGDPDERGVGDERRRRSSPKRGRESRKRGRESRNFDREFER